MPTVDRIYYELGQANDENNDPRSAEIHYLVVGAKSVQEAIDEAADVAPSKHEGISLSGFGFDDLAAPGSCKITAQYRHHPDDDDELGGREISIDIGANTDTRTEPWGASWSLPDHSLSQGTHPSGWVREQRRLPGLRCWRGPKQTFLHRSI